MDRLESLLKRRPGHLTPEECQWLFNEIKELYKQLDAKDDVICGMREAQIKVRQQLSLSFTPENRNKWLAFVDEVFVPHPICQHKYEEERLSALFKIEQATHQQDLDKLAVSREALSHMKSRLSTIRYFNMAPLPFGVIGFPTLTEIDDALRRAAKALKE